MSRSLRTVVLAALVALPLLVVSHVASGQPSQTAESPTGDNVRIAEGAAAPAAEPAEDPSLHFNFFDLKGWWDGNDELGGKFGDGVMVDPKTGEQVHGEEEKMSPPFILMLVNFGILLIILAKFGGPVAKKTAEERSDQIKTALEEAGKLRSEAQAKLTEYEGKLKDADQQITKLVDDLRADAAAEKERIVANAEAQAKAMQKDAEQRINAEIETARAALAREVARAATAAAEQLLRSKATPADHAKLVDSFLTDLTKVAAQRATTSQIPKEKA
jgi:F-type H+-transporting ATPase subunit b